MRRSVVKAKAVSGQAIVPRSEAFAALELFDLIVETVI
jgi:hypothetical protein